MTFKKFILSMLSGDDGLGISSKRVVSFIAFISIVVIAFVHLFTGYTIAEFIFDGLMYITIAGFFFNAIEAFSKRDGKNPTNTNINIRDTENVTVTPAAKPQGITSVDIPTEEPIVEPPVVDVKTDNNNLKENEIIG